MYLLVFLLFDCSQYHWYPLIFIGLQCSCQLNVYDNPEMQILNTACPNVHLRSTTKECGKVYYQVEMEYMGHITLYIHKIPSTEGEGKSAS